MSSYDQNLLGEVPKATRAQLQEGYNVDLLSEPSVQRTPSVRNPPPPQSLLQQPSVTVPLMPAVAETGSGEKFNSPAALPKPRTSFWRTRNGIVAVFVIVLVVIGAVVGGAVGGTVKKGSHQSVNTTGSNIDSSQSLITPLTATNNVGLPGSSPSSVGPTQGAGGGSGTSQSTRSTTSTLASTIPISTQNGENSGVAEIMR